MVYHVILQAKVGYALGVITFTAKELKKIQRVADVAYRPKIGLNRNFPNAVFQGPLEYGGRGNILFYINELGQGLTSGLPRSSLLCLEISTDLLPQGRIFHNAC